ncbi:MAG: gamma-glutamyl-gamma-aminobutyrate hydrolase family protein [Actinomycetota bacterium]|nr:gamma-glutamyl-gamma-aminobutyrate hydrolase family protein [Actinomycetota bacterium]
MTTGTMPLVGLTTYRQQATFGPWDTEAAVLPATYLRAVERAGGQPILIPPWSETGNDGHPDIQSLLTSIDALVLTGGGDIDPATYRARPHPETGGVSRTRDQLEIALARGAAQLGVPVLGICRGCQILNVAFGGDLIQHLPDRLTPADAGGDGLDIHRGGPGCFRDHEVHISDKSGLSRILGTRRRIRSYHHQGLGRTAQPMEPVARASDSTVEAIEAGGESFLLGVLWHPEEEEASALFDKLVIAAARRRRMRIDNPETKENA